MKKKRLWVRFLQLVKKISFQNASITVKICLGFGIVFITMILLSAINYTKYVRDKELSTQTTIEQMNSQAINKIDDGFADLDTITKFPLLQDYISYNQFILNLEQFNQNSITRLDFQRIFNLFAFRVFSYKSFIQSVFLYNLGGENFNMFSSPNLFVSDNTASSEEWLAESVDGFGKQMVIDTHKLPGYVKIDNNETPIYVFSVSRGIVDVDKSEVVGVLLVNCKLEYLADISDKMNIVHNQRTLIIGKEGNIIYDKDESVLAKKLDNKYLQFINAQPKSTQSVSIEGVKYLISYDTSPVTGWRIVNIIPLKDLYKSIDAMRNTTLLITMILVFFAVIFLILTIMHIVKPIKKLMLLMKLIQKGDFNVKLKFSNKDEVGQLARTFNSMAKKVNNLINEVYSDKIKQKDLELQMLQNQINPHFLYNTLESIHMMAKLNKDYETSRMAIALGNILRYSIGRNRTYVTVKEEIDHLHDYIMLQKVRFEDIFNIEVNVDISLYEKKILMLILQPIVENAIYHGMDSVESGGKIEVLGYEKENSIIFEVIDNGSGMDEKKVEKLNDYINDPDNTIKSIGLKNVNKRIQLHYGSEYAIKVYSRPEVGTKVQITIPLN